MNFNHRYIRTRAKTHTSMWIHVHTRTRTHVHTPHSQTCLNTRPTSELDLVRLPASPAPPPPDDEDTPPGPPLAPPPEATPPPPLLADLRTASARGGNWGGNTSGSWDV